MQTEMSTHSVRLTRLMQQSIACFADFILFCAIYNSRTENKLLATLGYEEI